MNNLAFKHIGGIQRTSLIDFPGVPATVLFMRGCNLRCPYCHNAELTVGGDELPPEQVAAELRKEADQGVEGVVFTGGEPLLRPLALLESIAESRGMGLKIKLDTNGIAFDCEDVMCGIIDACDYVAVDYKLPLHRYGELSTTGNVVVDGLKELIKLLDTGRDPDSYELRTTVYPGLLKFEDLEEMAEGIPRNRWYLQQFRGDRCLDKSCEGTDAYPGGMLADFAARLGCKVRGVA